jgi:hypothetical protein
MLLDYVALGLVIFVALFLFYGIIALHDIPYDIARHRNHPHQDAIHVAGWVSLFTLHVIWPFLWIWATIYREDRGWGFKTTPDTTVQDMEKRFEKFEKLSAQLERLQGEVIRLRQSRES